MKHVIGCATFQHTTCTNPIPISRLGKALAYNLQDILKPIRIARIKKVTLTCNDVTLFRSITLLCGIESIVQNIPHIQSEFGVFKANCRVKAIFFKKSFELHTMSRFLCWMIERYTHKG